MLNQIAIKSKDVRCVTRCGVSALFCLVTLNVFAASQDLPPLNESFGNAKAYTENQVLTVSTGSVTRQWQLTTKGLKTTAVLDSSGKQYVADSKAQSDWDLGALGNGKLISLKAYEDDDEKFTSKHLCVEAEFEYQSLTLKYVIWAYPDSLGLRTQLWIKSTSTPNTLGSGISERLMLAKSPVKVTAWGYKAGLKAGAKDYHVLDSEDVSENGESNRTSGLLVDSGEHGLILVKESHSHTNMHGPGCAIGTFKRQGDLLEVNGLGMLPGDVKDKYRFCWANWLILYKGDEIDAQMALKKFDRNRYPVSQERDVFIMANTWGTEDGKTQCLYKAREENVLREIEACANLGVDVLQIDDGWQANKWAPETRRTRVVKKGKKKAQTSDEFYDNDIMLNGEPVPMTYDVYPNGFGGVRDAAKKAGIRLGLWYAWRAPEEYILMNMKDGGFTSHKLDFAKLEKKKDLESLYYKARNVVKASGYSAVVNWDVTEGAPRMGFYFGRDCGNLYLENRKAATTRSQVMYRPWQILRDAWLLSKYTNLNKIQLTFQNKDHVPLKADNDAVDSTHDYNMAITLMSSPILFMETQYLDDKAVGILKPMLAKYKKERVEMYKGYVFPLGAMPNNAEWTGLQNHNPETGKGYLMIFRELHNKKNNASIGLHFLKPGSKIKLTDIMSGETRDVSLDGESKLDFEIPEAPGYVFLKYE